MDLKNTDHLPIKTDIEKKRELEQRIRIIGGLLVEWAIEQNITELELATVAYIFHRFYQEETAKLKTEELLNAAD